ncbi:hypothetical protein [Aureivirga sp. CE67]|uniref:hypothetical protein n=1 Tax=Aureivirga sp. CE67 TaxID=1788983 RepID=UPI0018CBCC9B|nr:hypothetical protein [Aureivirga sp. CE67]
MLPKRINKNHLLKLSIILISIVFFSCKTEEKKEVKEQIKKHINSAEKEKISEIKKVQIPKEKLDSKIYINKLNSSRVQNKLSVSLFFKESIPDSIVKKVCSNVAKISSDITVVDEEIITNLEESYVSKYFNTNGLDTLLVFNENQVLIDTIYREKYAHYQNPLDEDFIAIYNKSDKINSEENYIVMSKNDLFQKNSMQFEKDSLYMTKTAKKLSFDSNYISFHSRAVKGKDTISILTYFPRYEKNYSFRFYLLKNHQPVDSLINDFTYNRLITVPVNKQNEDIFVSFSFVPNSDVFWDSLIGIDWEEMKIKTYSKNRLDLK